MSESPERRELDRRAFLTLAAAAAAASALPAPAQAQAPAAATPATPAPPEHTGGEARLLTEVLRARYPDRFSEAQWGSIVGDFEGDLATGKRLRAVKLANGDEPDFTFRP
jgi:hypothetical protein